MTTLAEIKALFSDGRYPSGADFAALIDTLGVDGSLVLSGADDPTPSDIAAGASRLWTNTTSGETRLWANIGGTIHYGAVMERPWMPSDLYSASDGAFLDLTNSSYLYQADKTTLVTASAQLIGRATDLSGKGNHFEAVSGNEPSYVIEAGKGYCNFPGSKWLEKLITKPTAGYTVVSAFRGATGNVYGSGNSGASASTAWGQLLIDGTYKHNWAFGNGSLYSYGSSDAAMYTAATNVIAAETYLSGDTKPSLYKNNTTPIANTRADGTATALGGTSYKYSLGRLGEYTNTWTGRMYGHCIINRVLTTDELTKVMAYFSERMP